MKNKLFLIFVAFLLVASIVLAAPPQTEVFLGTTGFQIEYPSITTLQQNTDFTFYSHVYNLSNGQIISSGISCNFYLYNKTGNNLVQLEQNTPDTNLDFEFLVGGNNFSYIGNYAYLINCNSSTEGGFSEIPIEVTSSGNSGKETMSITFSIILIGVSLIFLLLSYSFDDEEHVALKILFLFIGMITLIISLNYSYLTSIDTGISLPVQSLLLTAYRLSLYGFILFTAYIVVYYIYTALNHFKKYSKG